MKHGNSMHLQLVVRSGFAEFRQSSLIKIPDVRHAVECCHTEALAAVYMKQDVCTASAIHDMGELAALYAI